MLRAAHARNTRLTSTTVARLATVLRLMAARSRAPRRASGVLQTGHGPHVDLRELVRDRLRQRVNEQVEEVDERPDLARLGRRDRQDGIHLFDLAVDVVVVLVE